MSGSESGGPQVVILTGVSGSGKTTALRAMEDGGAVGRVDADVEHPHDLKQGGLACRVVRRVGDVRGQCMRQFGGVGVRPRRLGGKRSCGTRWQRR